MLIYTCVLQVHSIVTHGSFIDMYNVRDRERIFSVACANVYMCVRGFARLVKCMHQVVQLTRMIGDELR